MKQLLSAQQNPPIINQPIPDQIDPKPNCSDQAHKVRKVKPSPPPEFDRDRTKGLALLNSCQTYIRLCPEDF